MSKINEIEKAILQLEGGRYQSLMDQYLYKKYNFDNIQSLGSQLGTDKTTKGIPDSYVRLDNGSYIAIMYGTRQDASGAAVFKKLKKDIEDCLQVFGNQHHVYKIICCHISSNLSIEQDDKLHQLFENLDLIGINTLANDLCNKYPSLAKEFLSVSVDTGQIMSPEDFIKNNNNSLFQTPLDVEVIGRDKEIFELTNALLSYDVVIIEGPSGIGKTKLAYEVGKEFSKTNGYIFYVLQHKNLPIYEDLRSYFSEDANYIILVDDANQLTDLELVLNLIKENSNVKSIKLLLTVRDYAKKHTVAKVQDIVRPYEYLLSALEDDVIKNIIQTNLEIRNQIFLDQIANIAKGNIRLAFMAGISTQQEGQFKNIQNASDIFKMYFKYIIEDFAPKPLILMAIIAFVEAFELDDDNSLVYKLIQFSDTQKQEVRDLCIAFHEAEIVDIYENSIVKFNDQNLSDYLIYYIFFQKKLYSLEKLIELTFPTSLQEHVIYHLSTTVELFGSAELHQYLTEKTRSLWKHSNYDLTVKYQFAEAFCAYIPNEVLSFLKREIDSVNVNQIDIVSQITLRHVESSDKILSILSRYKNFDCYDSALDLFIDYVNRNNSNLAPIKKELLSGFGMNKYSYVSGYHKELQILEYLFDKYKVIKNDNIAVLCVLYASHCLQYSYSVTETGYRKRQLNIIYYCICDCNGIRQLHSKAFDVLCVLFQLPCYHALVHQVLMTYLPSAIRVKVDSELLSSLRLYDSQQFEKYFSKLLNSSDVVDCKLINHFYDKFIHAGVSLSHFYYTWKNNVNYMLIKRLSKNYMLNEQKELFQESEKEQIIKQLASEFLLKSTCEIKALLTDGLKLHCENDYSYCDNLVQITRFFDQEIFVVFTKLLIEFTPNNYSADTVVTRLIGEVGFEKAYKIICSFDIKSRNVWFDALINNVDSENITENFCQVVIESLKDKSIDLRIQFKTLKKICEKYNGFLLKYIVALEKIDLSQCSSIISAIMITGIQYFKNDVSQFINFFDSVEQFEKLYILAVKSNAYVHDGKIFLELIKRDTEIFDALIDVYSDNTYLYDNKIDAFKKVWKLKEHKKIIQKAVKHIFANNKSDLIKGECLSAVFNSSLDNMDEKLESIKGLLQSYLSQLNQIGLLLQVTEEWQKKYRFDITYYACSLSNSIEIFQRCPIAPCPHVISGSEISYIESRIAEYREWITKLKGMQFIDHRSFCEDRIDSLQQKKRLILRREYIYNF